MGIVYLAREVQLDRLVAIKVLPDALAARPALRERFLREARTAAGLSHPHIVPIHRVGEAGGMVFFAMAFVEGETLGDRLRERGPMSPVAAARLLREVAWALAYAHGRGVIHRDVKPDNILLERGTGRALVTDFGIARVGSAGEVTDPGQVMGTAQFMSPEQAADEPVDGRSDLYSLGVVGFLALSGRLPFDGPTVPALLAQHLETPAPPVASVAPGAPDQLARAVDRCLRKDPAARFATGEALAEALEVTAVAKPELPTALRVWARQENPLRQVYVVWSGLFTIGTVFVVQNTLRHPRNGWGAALLTAGIALAPIVPVVGFHLRRAYQVFRDGYSLADLRLALQRWREERREELRYEGDAEPTLGMRALRIMAITSSVASVASGLFVHNLAMFGRYARPIVMFAPFVAVAACNALGVPILSRDWKRRSVGAMRARFWNSRVGEWTAKLLGAGKRAGVPAEMVHRRTEAALSLAAGELFAALPKAHREALAELPRVVGQLEERAAACRGTIDETTRLVALAEGSADDVAAAATLRERRDRAGRDLATTVAALESIRLDLLRLHGGTSDLTSLTTVLAAAQRVGEDLGRLVEAQREVDAIAPSWRMLEEREATPV